MAIARRVSVTLKASDIMAKKGIEEKKLKTGELNKIVGEFFMTHEARIRFSSLQRDSLRWTTHQRETSLTIST